MTDTKYKASLHLPTEQYGFIAVDVEDTPTGIVEAYRGFQRLTQSAAGLPEKDFNAFVDRQMLGESNKIEDYELASDTQKVIIQCVKRSLKRIAAKGNKV